MPPTGGCAGPLRRLLSGQYPAGVGRRAGGRGPGAGRQSRSASLLAAGQWASGEEFLCAIFAVPLSLLLLRSVTAGALSWLGEPRAEGTGQVGSRGEVTTQPCNLAVRRRGPASTLGKGVCVRGSLSIQPHACWAHALASTASLPSWVPLPLLQGASARDNCKLLSELQAASCPVSGPGVPIPG